MERGEVMDRSQIALIAVLLLLASFTSCYYFLGILVPEGRRVSSFQITGYGSDLYAPWHASREALLHHRDAYSDAVTREIQKGVYGETMASGRLSKDSDEQRFAYPLFTSFLLLPVLAIPFSVLQPLTSVVLAALMVWSVLLWSDALGIALNSGSDLLWAGLLMVWIPVVQGVSLQQLGLVVCFLLAASVYLVARNRLLPAGVLLAFAMMKPHLALPVAFWMAIWVSGDWRRRYKLVIAGATVMSALLIAAQLLQPGWINEWLGVLQQYRRYTQSRSPIEMVAGDSRLAVMITVSMWAVVAWVCFRLRKSLPHTPAFAAGLCLAIAAGVISSPNWLFHNQVILLPVGMWLLVWGKKFLSGAQRLLPLTCQFILIWYAGSAAVIVYAYFAGIRSENQLLLGLPFLSIFLAPPFFFGAALRSAIYISRRQQVFAKPGS
ncbi:MAG: glycosyltransferase family 87 protein [Terriglobales bacterium]